MNERERRDGVDKEEQNVADRQEERPTRVEQRRSAPQRAVRCRSETHQENQNRRNVHPTRFDQRNESREDQSVE